MVDSTEPFVGSEALSSGRIKRDGLRRYHRRLCPNVYLPRQLVEPSLEQRIRAAWLWSQRAGVIAGSAAAALHGAEWVGADALIELIHGNPRAPSGVVTRRELLLEGETEMIAGMTVTTAPRTGFDLGRRGALTSAVARMDALMRATDIHADSIAALARRHRGVRGLRQLDTVLDLADAGAQSPKESWLRLLLIRDGLPRPRTQIPVLGDDGHPIAFLDLGWPEVLVAVEYDGEHHRTDRHQYVKDIRRREMLQRKGWIVITVVAQDRAADIVRRVRAALELRSAVR